MEGYCRCIDTRPRSPACFPGIFACRRRGAEGWRMRSVAAGRLHLHGSGALFDARVRAVPGGCGARGRWHDRAAHPRARAAGGDRAPPTSRGLDVPQGKGRARRDPRGVRAARGRRGDRSSLRARRVHRTHRVPRSQGPPQGGRLLAHAGARRAVRPWPRGRPAPVGDTGRRGATAQLRARPPVARRVRRGRERAVRHRRRRRLASTRAAHLSLEPWAVVLGHVRSHCAE